MKKKINIKKENNNNNNKKIKSRILNLIKKKI